MRSSSLAGDRTRGPSIGRRGLWDPRCSPEVAGEQRVELPCNGQPLRLLLVFAGCCEGELTRDGNRATPPLTCRLGELWVQLCPRDPDREAVGG